MTGERALRVVVLGGSGMLGHRVWEACRERFDAYFSARSLAPARLPREIFDASRSVAPLEARDFDGVTRALTELRPAVVVNCVGIVKQQAVAGTETSCRTVNGRFPLRLATLCGALGSRLIHISTDCVFSGRSGDYTETDTPDPLDLYGRTKLLGEVRGPGCLTLRTSLIGRELAATHGLVEWFLSQRGRSVPGHAKAIFSGVTTGTLADLVVSLIADHPALEGLLHVAAEPISKFGLLGRLRDTLELDVEVVPTTDVVVDRSLDGTRFRQATGWVAPSWAAMLARLGEEAPRYERLRGEHAAG